MKQYVKIDDKSFKEIETKDIESRFNINSLNNKLAFLEAQVAQVKNLIAEAKKIGVEK